ncbi:PucR family transcriptional regulator [Nocardioides humilatus]|uniref:PucR family transcriptional regulator n=1 Tax=Nocardioides humilatus TaxID=2607660 RepID=A0A5B1LMC2_9ACTN|nr:helix-turn-helix domain-containing protein [Nocardioides humilatus]KAA1421664.1 PucR family transcriptional regulator [Nocardioides humilatus]
MVIAGQPVVEFLRGRHRELVDEVLETLVREVAIYGRLPRELIDGDVRRVVDRALRMFAAATVTSGRPAAEELVELADSAVRRAEEGVPMEAVLAAYFRGSRVATDALVAIAGPDDFADLRRVVEMLLTFLEEVCAAVASGYARHGRTLQAEQASARQVLVDVLLNGGDARSAAGPADVRLPESYLVCALVVGAHPDESDPTVDGQVAARRKLRRVREELDRHYGDPVLWRPQADGGLALVPSADLARLRSVLASVGRIAGASVHVGIARAAPDDVAAAAEVATAVAEVAQLTGRPDGGYELADVALDFQLRQPGPARAVLAALLDALDDRPDLAETLQVFVATGLNRRRTAAALAVHPNTVDNRLRRVAELTGLDPTDSADVPTIRAAIVARSSHP